jgi:hypothetical protein
MYIHTRHLGDSTFCHIDTSRLVKYSPHIQSDIQLNILFHIPLTLTQIFFFNHSVTLTQET